MMQRAHACCARFAHVDMGKKRSSGVGAVSITEERSRALVVRTIEHFEPHGRTLSEMNQVDAAQTRNSAPVSHR